jgi:predicted nucleotidyltransferase component of viral defense system
MQINWEKWIQSGGDAEHLPLRQAVHTVLLSISKCDSLKNHMQLKGGMLMALCYDSSRYTRDIDFSQNQRYTEGDEERLVQELDAALQVTSSELAYGLDCRVQSKELKPRIENPTFPTLNVKIGYAYKHEAAKHQRLLRRNSSTLIEIDFSYNETTNSAEEFKISESDTLLRYSLIGLMAEKFRALLQQEVRNRSRRQDIYDLYYLLTNAHVNFDDIKLHLLKAFIESAASKQLNVHINSMLDEKIIERTRREYELLATEVAPGTLPEFSTAYRFVTDFYMSLPWQDIQ